MIKITREQFENFPVVNGIKLCPSGDYTLIKKFFLKCNFEKFCTFSENTIFYENCKFEKFTIFKRGCKFFKSCEFSDLIIFYEECFFKEMCIFNHWSYFKERCIINNKQYHYPLSTFNMPSEIKVLGI